MLEFLSAALAKLSTLGLAAKGFAVAGVAAATVAAAGAGGVLPTLPSAGDDTAVEQVTQVSDDATEDSATDDTATDGDATDGDATDDTTKDDTTKDDTTKDDTTKDDTTKDDTTKGEPAPQASFGQGVAEDARDGGVNGQDISELARARNDVRRDDTAGAAGSENSNAGRDRATAGSENSNAGREKAAGAPVENAPAGTPAQGRVPARR